MRAKPPCKTPDGIECDKRYVGCSADCEAFHEFLVKHEEEKKRERESKRNEADDFLIKQTERVNRAYHRKYQREWSKGRGKA